MFRVNIDRPDLGRTFGSIRPWAWLLLVGLVLAVGCGGAPKRERSRAEGPLDRARAAARSGDIDEADRLYVAAYREEPRFPTLQEHVEFAIGVGRSERAVALARDYFEREGDDPLGFELYAKTLLTTGQARAALDVADQLVGLNEKNARGRGLRGRALLALGRTTEGIEDLQRAVALDKKRAELWVLLGEALLKAGRAADAVGALRTASRSQPENARAAALLGAALREQGQFKEARTYLDKAVRIDPTDARTYFELGIWHNKQKQQGGAQQALAKAVELNPDDATYWYAYGEILRLNEKLELAVSAYRRAIELKPPHPKAPGKLAIVLMAARRFEDAEVLLTSQLRTDPNNAQNYLYLGDVYVEANKLKLAIDAYEQFLELAPKDDRDRQRARQAIDKLRTRL